MNPSDTPEQFWQWFRTNASRLSKLLYGKDEEARDQAMAELRDASEQAAPGLVLEIAHAGSPEGQHSLVVSADGRPERADAVKEFVASAPELAGWNVVAFRPRMPISESIEIAIEDQQIGPADIWFRVEPDDFGLNLTLHVRALTPQNEQIRGLGASILAQHAIGEFDSMTLLSSLQVKPLQGDPAGAGLYPFGDLVAVFDEEKSKKYPPPGFLPLEGADEWQNMRGTADDMPIFVLLNSGIQAFAGHPDYDRSVTLTIPFHDVNEHGLPGSDEEYHEVQGLEDRLGDALQQDQASLLVASVLTQGRREMIFYTSDAASALGRIEEVRQQEKAHQIEVAVERDTFWGQYRSFFPRESEEEAEE
jgi:hypothetical protein